MTIADFTVRPKRGATFKLGGTLWKILAVEGSYKKGHWLVAIAPVRGKK